MTITSIENKKIKELSKLNNKKYRELNNKFLVESPHLVQEAFRSGNLLEVILLEGNECPYKVPSTYVNYEVMKKISDVETPNTIIGVCKKNIGKSILGRKILLLDNIQDPGNLGTIIRSSVAFDVDTIILSEGCVDLYNPKVIRSTQGMLFHINIITMNLEDAIKELKEKQICVYATDVHNGMDIRQLDNKDNYALVMGNEGNGVRESIKELCDRNIYIKMNENAESLNVAIATSIILYELGR